MHRKTHETLVRHEPPRLRHEPPRCCNTCNPCTWLSIGICLRGWETGTPRLLILPPRYAFPRVDSRLNSYSKATFIKCRVCNQPISVQSRAASIPSHLTAESEMASAHTSGFWFRLQSMTHALHFISFSQIIMLFINQLM